MARAGKSVVEFLLAEEKLLAQLLMTVQLQFAEAICNISEIDSILGGRAWSRSVNSSGINDNLMRSVRSYSSGCRGLGSLPSFFVFGQRNWNFE
jgi:hypothetical protein